MAHVTPYLTQDQFVPAVETVIDSTKDAQERVHAGHGVSDYLALMLIPHSLKAAASGCPDSEADLCAKVKALLPAPAASGLKAFDWKTFLQNIAPLVLALIERYLFS